MRKALILIDIQNDYFEGGNKELVGSLEASKIAAKLLSHFRANSDLIIHIQHINIREGSTFFLPETNGVQIHSSVEPRGDEKIINKHFPNSFRDTELLDFLKNSGVQELVFCGMMTHMCVDTTVRAAFDLKYSNILIADACATLDMTFNNRTVKAFDVQTSYMAALNGLFATVISADEYLKSVES